jgi:hypothetical protein
MSALREEYHPDVLARIYRVLFYDTDADRGWSNLVFLRNQEYATYITPPTCSSAAIQHWIHRANVGELSKTLEALNKKWDSTFKRYILTAVAAGQATRVPLSCPPQKKRKKTPTDRSQRGLVDREETR